MKKIICFILTFCVMFQTIFVTAYATKSVDLYENFEHEFNVLYALGFLDEEFNKEKVSEGVSREQALDAIVKMCSFDFDAYKASGGYTYFTDVTPESKYFSSICYAAENGILVENGGVFEPQKTITTMEAVAFIMRAAGYKTYAEVNGGYPVGYMKAARLSGLNSFEDKALTKADFVSLLFKAMECEVYEQRVYGLDGKFSSTGKTVIEHFHDIYKVQGQVTATFASSLTKKEISGKNTICIGDFEYRVENEEYSNLLGYYVEAYYHEDDVKFPKIVYMAEDPNYDILVIKADDITDFSGLSYRYGEKNRRANIAANHNLIVNGVRMTDYSERDFVPINGYVVLIGDNKNYDTVIVNTFRNYFLQRMAVGVTESITLTEYDTLRRFDIELNDEKSVEVYVDNEKVNMKPFSYTVKDEEFDTYTFADIPEGSGCSIFADKYENLNGWIIPAKDAKVIRLYVSTPQIQGKCVSYNDSHIRIDDTAYEISELNELENIKAGDYGYFILDYDGKVFARYDNRYLNNISYAYLINAITCGAFDDELKIKLMTDTGKIAVYTIKDKVKINGKVEKKLAKVRDSLSASAKLLDSTFSISQPVKVHFDKNGQISELQTVAEEDTEYTINRDGERRRLTSRHDNGYMLYSGGIAHYLQPKQLFEVPNRETFDDDDYKVLLEWLPNYEAKTLDVIDVNSYRVPELAVSYVSKTEQTLYRPLVMVSKILTAINDDESICQEIMGYDGYDKVYYYSEDLHMFDGVKEGDVIRVYGRGEEVTSWEYLLKIDDVKKHNFSDDYGRQGTGLYEVYSLNGSNFTLQHDGFLEGDSGKRKSQLGFLWTTDVGSFTNGAVYYDGTKRKDKISSFYINSGVPADVIQTVKNVGNENATKVYISMENGMIKFVSIYNGLEE